ncbi:MAG: hypothetical protein ACRDTJ_21070 [Pseudonocardiaceae bacterium]
MSIWPRQRDPLPITDPRWLVSTQPDPEDVTPEEFIEAMGLEHTHWLRGAYQARRIACGAPAGSRASISEDLATCPDCLTTVARLKCYEPRPGDILGLCCMRDLDNGAEHDGPHDWERDDVEVPDEHRRTAQRLGAEAYATTAQREALSRRQAEVSRYPELADSPSGMLPVRTPGEALGDAARGRVGRGGLGESAGPLESDSEREVLETWTV